MEYTQFGEFEKKLKPSNYDGDDEKNLLSQYLTVCEEFPKDDNSEAVKELKLVLYLYFFGFDGLIGALNDSKMYTSRVDKRDSKWNILSVIFKKTTDESPDGEPQNQSQNQSNKQKETNPFDPSIAIPNVVDAIFGNYIPYEFNKLSFSTKLFIAAGYCVVGRPIDDFNTFASSSVLKALKDYLLTNIVSVNKRESDIIPKCVNYEIPFTNFTDLSYFVIMNDDKKLDTNLFTTDIVQKYIKRYFGIEIASVDNVGDVINEACGEKYTNPYDDIDTKGFTDFRTNINNVIGNLNKLFINEFHRIFEEYNRSRVFSFMSIDTFNRYSAIINISNYLNQSYYEILNNDFIESSSGLSVITTFGKKLNDYKCVFFLMKNREARERWDLEKDKGRLFEEFVGKVPKLTIAMFMAAFKKARYDLYNDNLRIVVKNVPDVSDDNDLKGTDYEHFKDNLASIKQADINIHFYERLRYFINSDSLTSFFIPIVNKKLRLFPMDVPNYNVENDYDTYFKQSQKDLVIDVGTDNTLKYRRISYYRIFLRKGVKREHLLFLMGCLANGSCNYVKQSQISWHMGLGEMLETLPEFFDSDNKDLRCMNCMVIQRRLHGCNHRFHQIIPRIFYNDFIEECRKKYKLLEGPIIPVGMIHWKVSDGVPKNMIFDNSLMDFSKDMFETVTQKSIERLIEDEYESFLDGNVVKGITGQSSSIYSEQDTKKYLNELPYSSISEEEFKAFCDNDLIKQVINKNKLRKLNEAFCKLSSNNANDINTNDIIAFSEAIFNTNDKNHSIKLQDVIGNKPSKDNRLTPFMKIFGKICDSYESNHCINDIFNDIKPSEASKKFSLYNVVRNLSSFIDSCTFFKESYAYCVIRIFFDDIIGSNIINTINIVYDIRRRGELKKDGNGDIKMSLLKYDDMNVLCKYADELSKSLSKAQKSFISSFKTHLKFDSHIHPNLYDHFQNIRSLKEIERKNVLESLNNHFKKCIKEAAKHNIFKSGNTNDTQNQQTAIDEYKAHQYAIRMYHSKQSEDFTNNFNQYFKGYYDTLIFEVMLNTLINNKQGINTTIEYKYDNQTYSNITTINIDDSNRNIFEKPIINGQSFGAFLDGLRDELLLRKFLFTVNDGYNYFDAKVDYQHIKNPLEDGNIEYRKDIDAIMLKHNISSTTDTEMYNFNQVAVLLKSFFKTIKDDNVLNPILTNPPGMTFDINTSDNPKQMLLAIAVIATFTNN